MADVIEDDDEEGKKKSTLIPTLAVVGGLSLIAAGGGWFLGGSLSGSFLTDEKKQEIAKEAKLAALEGVGETKKEDGPSVPRISTEENGVVALEPITSNLAYPSENWIRLEISLLFDGSPDLELSEEIHQDITAYLRTVSMQQIQGPRGFQFLKEDLAERVEIRSQGKVKKIMIRTFVIE